MPFCIPRTWCRWRSSSECGSRSLSPTPPGTAHILPHASPCRAWRWKSSGSRAEGAAVAVRSSLTNWNQSWQQCRSIGHGSGWRKRINSSMLRSLQSEKAALTRGGRGNAKLPHINSGTIVSVQKNSRGQKDGENMGLGSPPCWAMP